MKNLQLISSSYHIVDSIKAGFAFDQGFYVRSIENKGTIGAWKFQNHRDLHACEQHMSCKY
jgi:hypothetical protein